MPTLRLTVESYGGWDPDKRRPIRLSRGETLEVSESQARRLTTDFPSWFEYVEAPTPIAPPREVVPRHRKPAQPAQRK
jgi:hypothetical protein